MSAAENHDWVDAETPVERRRRVRWRPRPAHLITDARRSPEQNRHSREVRYLILQLLRLPLVAASLWLGFEGYWWWAFFTFLVSVPLPWVAVVIANEKGEVRDKRERNVYKPAAARQEAFEAQRQAALEARSRADDGSATHPPATIEHDENDR